MPRITCLLGMHMCRLSAHSFGDWHWVLRACRYCPYIDPMHRERKIR